jgi:hypothetical protein
MTPDELMQLIACNAQAIAANGLLIAQNSRDIAELRAAQAASQERHEADYNRFRAEQVAFQEQREQDERDWRDDRADMHRAITATSDNIATFMEVAQLTIARVDRMQDEVTTLQGQTQDTINQVRDLQVLGNRNMERLERLDGGQL